MEIDSLEFKSQTIVIKVFIYMEYISLCLEMDKKSYKIIAGVKRQAFTKNMKKEFTALEGTKTKKKYVCIKPKQTVLLI